MLSTYLKGVAAISTAGLLLFGAGSAARADLGAPGAPGVDANQAQQQPAAPSNAAPVGYQPQDAMRADPRSSEYGQPSTPQRHESTPTTRQGTPHDTTGYTPAPPSFATANAVNAAIIDTCISCTSAGAGSNSARAKSTAIRLLGNNIQAGEGTGNSKNAGALLAIPANPLLFLALADWEENTTAGPTSTSHSRASLVDLVIGPDQKALGGAISVAILESTSDASYQGLSSTGAGSNNGVDLNIGNGALVIILLHSDASSANKGSAYVLGINGTQILSSDQTGAGGIPISVPGVIGLVLLQVGAGGGNGANNGTSAAVGTVSDLLGQSGTQLGVLTASAVGLTGLAATPNAGIPPVTGTAPSAAAAAGGLKAPNTGAAIGLGGLLLLLSGGGLLAANLRRRQSA